MSKIDEARDILEQLGLPPAQRRDFVCLTLLALTGFSEQDAWIPTNPEEVDVQRPRVGWSCLPTPGNGTDWLRPRRPV